MAWRTITYTSGTKLGRALRRATAETIDSVAALATGAIHHAHEAAVEYATDQDLVHLGDYVNGFRVVLNPSDYGGGALTNDSEHANTIEYGRRPGAAAPPYERIERWVRDKLNPPERSVYPITQEIRRRIVERGLPPKRVFLHAGQEAARYLDENTPEALRRFVDGLIKHR